MQIDVNQAIGSITRTVSGRDAGGAPARVIVAVRGYSAPPAEVWDALTRAERIPRWFLPISGELRPGGRYQLQGNAGGEILECDAPRRLAITWEMHGQPSWVNLTLSEGDAGGTRLELEHVAHVPAEFWSQFGPGAVGVGWDQALLGLGQHLDTGVSIDPQEAMRWAVSSEGRSFVQQSSDAWRAASVAGGEDAEAAAAAAARTTAFYMGDPPGGETET